MSAHRPRNLMISSRSGQPVFKRAELLARLPKNGICAEIGVWKGNFSAQILDHTEPRELHLIDPWAFSHAFPGRWYGGAKAQDQHDMDAIHRAVARKFVNRPEVRIHRNPSRDAAGLFPDGYFDWVYIDGDHSYEAVLEDLTLWSAKVKAGGWIAGDDYNWRDEAGTRAVARAVKTFVSCGKFSEPETMSGQFLIKR